MYSQALYVVLFGIGDKLVRKVKIIVVPSGVDNFSLHDVLGCGRTELLRDQYCRIGVTFFDLPGI
jgi:hypothetical protein